MSTLGRKRNVPPCSAATWSMAEGPPRDDRDGRGAGDDDDDDSDADRTGALAERGWLARAGAGMLRLRSSPAGVSTST